MRAIASCRPVATFLFLSWSLFAKDKGAKRHLFSPLAALASVAVTQSVTAVPRKHIRQILILNEARPSFPAITIINDGIQTALKDSPYHIAFYSEFFETILFPDPGTCRKDNALCREAKSSDNKQHG
jgi:hypothetical protein